MQLVQNTPAEMPHHIFQGNRPVVKCGDKRHDRRSRLGDDLHVAQMNAGERRFAGDEDQRTAFFKRDVGGAVDKVVARAAGDRRQRTHGARTDDHAGMPPGAA